MIVRLLVEEWVAHSLRCFNDKSQFVHPYTNQKAFPLDQSKFMVWSQEQYRHLTRFKALLQEYAKTHDSIVQVAKEYTELLTDQATLRTLDGLTTEDRDMTFRSIEFELNAVMQKVRAYRVSLFEIAKKTRFLSAEVDRNGMVSVLKPINNRRASKH
jgi:hypothetical protein